MPIVHGKMGVSLWMSEYKKQENEWKEIICQKRKWKKLKELNENDINFHTKSIVKAKCYIFKVVMWWIERHANAMEAWKSAEIGKNRTRKAGNREKTEQREMTWSIKNHANGM